MEQKHTVQDRKDLRGVLKLSAKLAGTRIGFARLRGAKPLSRLQRRGAGGLQPELLPTAFDASG